MLPRANIRHRLSIQHQMAGPRVFVGLPYVNPLPLSDASAPFCCWPREIAAPARCGDFLDRLASKAFSAESTLWYCTAPPLLRIARAMARRRRVLSRHVSENLLSLVAIHATASINVISGLVIGPYPQLGDCQCFRSCIGQLELRDCQRRGLEMATLSTQLGLSSSRRTGRPGSWLHRQVEQRAPADRVGMVEDESAIGLFQHRHGGVVTSRDHPRSARRRAVRG